MEAFIRKILTFVLLASVLGLPSATLATDFSALFVFGDSLSDVGNVSSATFELQPGPRYYEGRFSNGPVFSELFADLMDLGPLQMSEEGGNNFAFGGGRTAGTSFFEGGFLLNDLDEQVDEFLEERTVDPDALYMVLAGANDFVLGDQTNPAIPARRVERELTRLVNAGARNLFSIDLPLLGDTPRFANLQTVMNNRTTAFNEQLSIGLDRIEQANPDVQITRLSMQNLFGHIVSLPDAFGFTNVTDEGIDASDAAGYVFWDNVHPTTMSHALLANAAYSLFDPESLVGDFNFDGELEIWDIDLLAHAVQTDTFDPLYDLTMNDVLDIEDIDHWLTAAGTTNADADLNGEVSFNDFLTVSRSFGTTEDVRWSNGDFDANGEVGFPDFLILARHFGNVSEPPRSQAIVPEPAHYRALLIWLASLAMQFRVSRRSTTFDCPN